MSDEQVLVGRYELGRLIGRGGMAEVHAAHDRLLDREVAVKVLRERFRDDESFTARFHEEARHVARLSHPNLVIVFDTGVEGDRPFIVMERIRGRTLQQALDAGGLTEDRALQVAADVCGALAYAHQNLIVHRDVKPGNIMLADDGSVKVTDFGIARAMSEENVTATAAVLGTAAYLSPEQAQGRRVDARSDLYSLGVVLYELLTGQVPFTGDSPVSVAVQHVRATPEPPRRLVPGVSRAAETIVMRLLAKDPDRRYQQAEDVRVDLERARRGEPPLALRPPSRAPAVRRTPAEAAGAEGGVTGTPGPDEDGADASGLLGVAEGVTEVPTVRDRVVRIAGYVALAAVLVGVFLGARALLTAEAPPEPEVAVPRVVGSALEDALAVLEQEGLRAGRIREVESETAAPGTVMAQQPSAGTDVTVGGPVDLTVARSPALVTVPNVAGLVESQALQRLRESGLVPGTRDRAASDTQPAGTVITTRPGPGTRVAVDTVVEVTVSSGPAVEPVRRVVGRPLAESIARLEDQGFVVEVTGEANAAPVGTVVRQSPQPLEEAAVGSTVRLWASTGPGGDQPLPGADDEAADGTADGTGAGSGTG